MNDSLLKSQVTELVEFCITHQKLQNLKVSLDALLDVNEEAYQNTSKFLNDLKEGTY